MPDRDPVPADRVVDRWDTAFDALRAEPRRRIVGALLEAAPDEPVHLPGAAVGTDRPVDRDALRIQLHHHHLPLLADAKYVRWQSDPFRAFRGPRFSEIGFVLESVRRNADRAPEQLSRGCPTPERN